MISPIGTVLTNVDTGMSGAVTSLVGLVSQQIPGPLGVGVVILFAYQGVQVANGDSRPLREMVPWMAGFGIVFWMITTPATYLYYARDVVFTGFPTALIAAVSGTGTLSTPTSVGAVLDSNWAQVWDAAAMIGQTAPNTLVDITGFAQTIMGFVLAWAGGVALAVCATVYALCRFFLDIEVVIGPVLIACYPFPAFRHYFHSWKGVGISLVLAEVAVFITAQIALLACQPLMAKMTNAMISAISNPGSLADALQAMAAMIIVLWMAATAIVAVPAICFFLGRGGGSPISTPIVGS